MLFTIIISCVKQETASVCGLLPDPDAINCKLHTTVKKRCELNKLYHKMFDFTNPLYVTFFLDEKKVTKEKSRKETIHPFLFLRLN